MAQSVKRAIYGAEKAIARLRKDGWGLSLLKPVVGCSADLEVRVP